MTGGIGLVEPGDGTAPAPDSPRPRLHPRRPGGRPARRHERYRRPVPAAALTLAGAAYPYASRPQAPPAPPPPYPSQAVGLACAGPVTVPPGTLVCVFGFAVLLSVRSGPPVTVPRLAQPYDGVTVTSSPTAPFQTKSHSARKIIVTPR